MSERAEEGEEERHLDVVVVVVVVGQNGRERRGGDVILGEEREAREGDGRFVGVRRNALHEVCKGVAANAVSSLSQEKCLVKEGIEDEERELRPAKLEWGRSSLGALRLPMNFSSSFT